MYISDQILLIGFNRYQLNIMIYRKSKYGHIIGLIEHYFFISITFSKLNAYTSYKLLILQIIDYY